MAVKYQGTSPNFTKKYLYITVEAGPVRHFEYVTTDTALVVEACGYFLNTTEQGLTAYNMLQVGDYVRVVTVAALVDTRPIHEDKAAGILGCQEMIVIRKDDDVLELSGPLFGTAAVSYTS